MDTGEEQYNRTTRWVWLYFERYLDSILVVMNIGLTDAILPVPARNETTSLGRDMHWTEAPLLRWFRFQHTIKNKSKDHVPANNMKRLAQQKKVLKVCKDKFAVSLKAQRCYNVTCSFHSESKCDYVRKSSEQCKTVSNTTYVGVSCIEQNKRTSIV